MGRATVAIWLQFLRRLGVGIVFIYVAVVLIAGGTSAAMPLLYALSGLWFLVMVALRFKTTPDASTPWPVRWFEIAATNAAGSLLLAELVVEIFAATAAGSLLVHADLDAHRMLLGHDYGAGLYGNALGYPGPELPAEKKPGVFRIAALGDSFAVGPAVPFADNYLTRLSHEMPGVEVGNFGVSGAGPREYGEILRRDVWPLQPDLVLVSVFVGNDITETLPHPRRLDPRRHALYLLCQRGWALAQSKWQTSDMTNANPLCRLDAPPLSPQTFREVEARRLAVCMKDAPAGMEKKWQRTLAELDAIVEDCRRNRVALAIVLIPDEFQVNAIVLQNALEDSKSTREHVDLDGPQRRLQAFFAERDVPCLNLLPAFRSVPDTYASRDTHWNVTGNHLAAREIAAWLSRLNQTGAN